MTIIELVNGLKNAERLGSGQDVPEGSRYVQLSDTLVKEIVEYLEDLVRFMGHNIK